MLTLPTSWLNVDMQRREALERMARASMAWGEEGGRERGSATKLKRFGNRN